MIELAKSEWELQENGEIHVRVQHEHARPWAVATDVVDNGDGTFNAHVYYSGTYAVDEEVLPFSWEEDVHLLAAVPEDVPQGGTVEIGVGEDVTVHNDGLG